MEQITNNTKQTTSIIINMPTNYWYAYRLDFSRL